MLRNIETDEGIYVDPESFAVGSDYYAPKHGTVSWDPATGLATYTPQLGYAGFDNFRYTITAR